MKRKLANVLVLALLLCLHSTAAPKPQRMTSFSGLAKGEGTFEVSATEKHKINSVWVNLKEDGSAAITLISEVQMFVEGQWSTTDDPSKGIDLKITGVVSSNASGSGKLFLRSDGKSIDRLNMQAKGAAGRKFKVQFVAEP